MFWLLILNRFMTLIRLSWKFSVPDKGKVRYPHIQMEPCWLAITLQCLIESLSKSKALLNIKSDDTIVFRIYSRVAIELVSRFELS